MRTHVVLVLLMLTAVATAARGQERIPWSETDPRERTTVEGMLDSSDWPFRVFALLRLERYEGAAVRAKLEAAVGDDAWQVRCFALRAAARLDIAIDPELLAGEADPRVIRAALRSGLVLPGENVARGAKELMATRSIDDLVLGLEIAAASPDLELREEATRRLRRLIGSMDDGVCVLVSRRLATLLDLRAWPSSANEWRQWAQANSVELPAPDRARDRLRRQATTEIAAMDHETLTRLRDYLGVLRQRDLELCLVMDATMSMTPMINEARAGVNALIVFMSDISRSLRLAFVAYRDHDNAPVWEGHPLTNEVDSIRDFLFRVRITGGADYPEAVLDGLAACRELDWSRDAVRQIILVGDAPPHDRDLAGLGRLLNGYREDQFVVHAVHVPQTSAQWSQYNARTAATFEEIARLGDGRVTALTDSSQLVPSVMRFTIEESWWAVFDTFYELYLESCR